jgi:hypothetical protein
MSLCKVVGEAKAVLLTEPFFSPVLVSHPDCALN